LQALREKQEQEKIEREKELSEIQEKQRLKEIERLRKMKRQRRFTITVLVFLFISFGAVWWAFRSYQEAEEQKLIAVDNEIKANQALQDFRKSQFDLNFTNGKTFQKETKYREAIEKYQMALQFDSVLSKPEYSALKSFEYINSNAEAGKLEQYIKKLDSIAYFPSKDSVLTRIISCKHSMENKDDYNKLMLEANELWRKKEYVEAMKKYIDADTTDYNPGEISEIIDKKKVEALKEWEKDIDDFEKINDYELIEITVNKRNELIRIYNNYKR
jgi:hypothetical protein